MLGQRLRELEESGIVRRRKLAPPAAVQVYELTEWGRRAGARRSWRSALGQPVPSFPRGAEMGPDSLVLALKSTFQPEKADGLDAIYELRLGEIPFKIAVKEGSFEAARARPRAPDAMIRSDPGTDRLGGLRRKTAGEGGGFREVAIEGSRRAVNALFRCST